MSYATNPTPSLHDHISDVQVNAMRLHAILDVLAHLGDEGACGSGRLVLVDIAAELAAKINNDLDTTNLPGAA